ncbi:MAG: methyltransferase domain-containing protein [Chloroflexi bacterium]|nr:methyltransferase domain-containing protein [Chloroflexota bacterium]
MADERVRQVYGIWQARWYDPFKWLWNILVASGAEKDMNNFLRDSLDENETILELGCGTALNLEKIFSLGLKFKRYLGIDFSPEILRITNRKFQGYSNVEFREKNITRLEDINDKFDIIICTWVLSHLPSASSFVNRAQGLMKEQGKFFLIFFSEPRWYLRFWIAPLELLVWSRYVTDEEVSKFKNIRKIRSYSGRMVTVVEIHDAGGLM